MSWREKLVARILLVIALLVADDPVVRREVQNLANHIGVHAPDEASS